MAAKAFLAATTFPTTIELVMFWEMTHPAEMRSLPYTRVARELRRHVQPASPIAPVISAHFPAVGWEYQPPNGVMLAGGGGIGSDCPLNFTHGRLVAMNPVYLLDVARLSAVHLHGRSGKIGPAPQSLRRDAR